MADTGVRRRPIGPGSILKIWSRIVGAFGWLPAVAWNLELPEALMALEARQTAVADAAQVLASAVWLPLMGEEARTELLRSWSGEQPVSDVEAFGPEVAAEIAEAERKVQEFVKAHRKGT